MQSSLSKVSVGVLVIVMGLAFLLGNTGQVYAYHCHHSGCHGGGGWGGWGGYSSYYSYYYPYYSYYYPYYSSYYGYGSYPYSYSYGSYPYSYSYGYGNYAYNQQYQLTVNANPSTLSNAVSGAGQYGQGTSASFAANQNMIQVSQDTRYIFSNWTGDYSGTSMTGSLTMDAAKSVTAVYQLQYYLSVSSQPSNAATIQGSGWFNSGTSTVISIPSQVVSGNSGSRLTFSGWSVDGSPSQTGSTLTIQMNAPHTVIAQYNQQYFLTVSSNQGSVSGQGWYDAGSTAQISASTPPNPSYGINMVFNGWQGDIQSPGQSTTVLMDGPKSVTGTWNADPTVLYVTVALVVVAVAVVVVIGALVWGRRRETQWQPTQTQYVQPTQTRNVEPIASKPSVNSSPSNANLNQTSDVQPAAHSNAHRHRRTHTTVPSSEPPSPEGSNVSKTEGQT